MHVNAVYAPQNNARKIKGTSKFRAFYFAVGIIGNKFGIILKHLRQSFILLNK